MSGDINVQSFSGKVNISNNLLVGSSHLFVDTVNNRVGITTASPGASLEVNGNVHVGTDLTLGGTLTGDGSGLANVNSDSGLWAGAGTGSVYLSTSTDKVGIGTTSPGATLDIRGSTNDPSTPTVHIGDNVADQGDYGMVNLVRDATNGGTKAHLAFIRNGNTIFGQGYYNNTNTFGFWSSFGSIANLPAMSITTTGNVGIGVADPATTGLHVANSYNPSGGNTTHFDPQIYISGDTGTNGTQVSAIGFNGNSASVGHRRMVAGSMYYKGTTGNYGMDGYLGLAVADISTGGADPYGLTEGELESHTRLAITNAGNVGIGNTTPTQILDVGSSLSNPFICRHLSGSLHDADKRDSVSFGRIDGSDFLGMKCRVDTHTDLGYGDYANQTKIGFFTWGNSFANSREVMSILGNGNVGIGTNNPLSTLQVGDGTGATSGDAPGSISLAGTGATKSNGGKPGLYHRALVGLGLWSDGKMSFEVNGYNGNQIEAMRILETGNVGIGTTTPTQILDVGSSLSNPFICRHLSGSLHDADKRDSVSFGRIDGSDFLGMKCRVDTHTDLGYGDYANQTKIGFFTWGNNIANSREVMSILGNGNVGIGVTDPDSKLEVRGNIRASFSDTDHGMFIDAGGTILRDYGGNGAGFHFTANAIWPTNYLGAYSAGGIDLGSSSYRWNNVYTEDLNASGTVTTGPILYVGTNTNNETAKTIYFGGTYGDNAYDHCVIERRIWQTGTEKQELLLFSGNDGETVSGPDRIRLKGAQILFDTLNSSTDRTTENTKMTVKSDGVVINSGTLRKPGNPGCRVTMTGSQFTLGLHSVFPIVYDSEYHDTGNDYNTSTGKFTCPVAGKYLCIHMMTTRSTRTRVALSEVKLYHNTTETARQFQDTTQDSACATNVINCAAGDTLYAGIFNANASNEFNGGTEYGSQFIVEFLG